MKRGASRLELLLRCAFSILERIDVGETPAATRPADGPSTFSILERIDVGETTLGRWLFGVPGYHFQYPRTDRRG